MQPEYHESMTRAALAPAFSPRALEAIVRANLGQDSPRNLLRGKFHFDAHAFEEAHRFVAEQRGMVSGALPADPPAAWHAFGRLTHALQDFYSHTNYLALWIEHNPGADATHADPVSPEILHSPKLFAARVYWPWEALTIFPVLRPLMRRQLPADSHANMNLDDPGRGPLFPLAIAAAQCRTQLALEENLGGLNALSRTRFLDQPDDYPTN